MTNRYRLIILFLAILIIWKSFQFFQILPDNGQNEPLAFGASVKAKEPTIKVTIYYEALCSDSRNFIINQLQPTYEKLSDYMQLDFVPYGKASTIEENGGVINFRCQHGKTECLANKFHACSLAQISDPDLQLKYVSCMIDDNLLPETVAEKCASDLNVPYNPILECVNDKRGSVLLKEYGVRTHAVSPSISFIPTVELNNSQKVPLGLILKNLTKELCSLLSNVPNECRLDIIN